MRIGIILGSIRETRRTAAVADYVAGLAAERTGAAEYDLIDLGAFNLPLLTTSVHPMASKKQYADANVQRWSEAIDACDAFVFVTPEYNHGVPGGFKNAVDSLGAEWVGKPVAFAGHGTVSGVRAIEQWRQIIINFSMPTTRAELNFNGFTHWPDDVFAPEERHEGEVHAMLDELEELVSRLGRPER